MSAKNKISGFTTALLIAVISFFVIYLFFPSFSQKYLGISFKSDRAAATGQKNSDKNQSTVKKTDDSIAEEIGEVICGITGKIKGDLEEEIKEKKDAIDIKKLLGE